MPVIPTRRYTADTAERLLWTTLQFGVGLGIAEVAELDAWWAAPIGVGLAFLKALAAKHLGQRNTASTLSAASDPAGAVEHVSPPSL